MVCLVWLVIYVTDYHEATRPRRLLTYFVLVCTLLYFCHAWYFLTKEESYGAVDALYMFCNLAVYPLFYCYILMLTKGYKFSFWSLMVLLPSLPAATLPSSLQQRPFSAWKFFWWRFSGLSRWRNSTWRSGIIIPIRKIEC